MTNGAHGGSAPWPAPRYRRGRDTLAHFGFEPEATAGGRGARAGRDGSLVDDGHAFQPPESYEATMSVFDGSATRRAPSGLTMVRRAARSGWSLPTGEATTAS